jgi:uncharacterized membrane protein
MTNRSRAGAQVSQALPTKRLAKEAQNLLNALAERALTSVAGKLGGTAERLIDRLEHGGPGVKSALSGAKALAAGKSPFRAALGAGKTGVAEKIKQVFGGGGGKKALKLTNIVEQQDVGAPIRVAYDQWTEFESFPSFMKKVESVEQEEDEKLAWKAHIWWSHRNWESTVVEQVPDDHIVWRSKGPKGYVDGAVSFSELAPNLTRILLVMEYHPQGFVEQLGNLWRAQGRRARLELKHFRRHVMSYAILHPEEISGWRGEIRDGQVVKTHEEAVEEEERLLKEREQSAEEPAEAYEEEPYTYDEEEPYEEADEEAELEEEAGARYREAPADEEPRRRGATHSSRSGRGR